MAPNQQLHKLILLNNIIDQERRFEAIQQFVQNSKLFRNLLARRRRRRCHRRWPQRFRPVLTYRPGQFELDDYSDEWCYEHLRFTKDEIRQFLLYLQLDTIEYRNRCTASPEVAICLVLWRLSYPRCYKDAQDLFGHSKSWQSIVFNDTILHLVNRFREMLFWDPQRLTLEKVKEYSRAISSRCPSTRVWGFVDGTIRQICRPSSIPQRPLYSGYAGYHCIKFQAIATPDGLTSSLNGLHLGSIGDWRMWHESGIEEKLKTLFLGLNDNQELYIYRDPVYGSAYRVVGAYRRTSILPLAKEQKQSNK
jgi:hypothetical protein